MPNAFYQPGAHIWFNKKGQSRVHEGKVLQYRENSGLLLVEPVDGDPKESEWFMTHDINIVDFEVPQAEAL